MTEYGALCLPVTGLPVSGLPVSNLPVSNLPGSEMAAFQTLGGQERELG